MRKYLLPGLLCSAIGAVVVLVVLATRESPPKTDPVPPDPDKTAREPEAGEGWRNKRRSTPTPLHEHEALSELERALAREDLSNAMFFRQKVCEQIQEIIDSDKLRGNLIAAIKKYGVNSDDPKRRDVVLPILRVLNHPDATALIKNEYFAAKNESEQMLLIEAMSKHYHDPKTASVWAVDKALTSESEENRQLAFEAIYEYSRDQELAFDTANLILQGTTRKKQARRMARMMAGMGETKKARDWMRKQLKAPRAMLLEEIAGGVAAWGDEDDAAQLEVLAKEFPNMAEVLREQAEMIRTQIADRKGDAEREKLEAEKRRRVEEEAKKKAEEEAAAEGNGE